MTTACQCSAECRSHNQPTASTRKPDPWVLWGWTETVVVPIKLASGTMPRIRAEQRAAENEGWHTAIHKATTRPEALILQASKATNIPAP